mgnify:FL=1|nr:MAG TPA: hypothetical protein [Caudoviricetes sp.]
MVLGMPDQDVIWDHQIGKRVLFILVMQKSM